MTERHAVVFPNVRFYVTVISNLPLRMRGRAHLHPHYELMWLSKGEASFFYDFEHYPLQAGALAFIGSGQLHTWHGDWDSFELRVVGFNPSIFTTNGLADNFIHQFSFFRPGAVPVCPIPESESVLFQTLFDTAYDRFNQQGHQALPLLVSYLTTLLMEADRLYDAPLKAVPQTASAKLTEQFRQLVEQDFSQRLKVQSYAERLGVTNNHLVKTVRQTIGVTPGKFIQQRLLLEAKRLLVHSDQPVAEIAYQLSFGSPTQFGHWFRQIEDRSPGQFRQQFNIISV